MWMSVSGNAEKIYAANGTNHIHWGHEGSMEAISFINSTTYGTNLSGWNFTKKGQVPGQVMADLEDGLWMGNKKLPPKPDMHATYGKKPRCDRAARLVPD
jgi:hypothetical protein